MADLELIRRQSEQAARQLLAAARPEEGALCVIGCSTSETAGAMIGTASSEEVAQAIWEGLYPVLSGAGLQVAVQGCEHINRCLCVTRECARAYGLRLVSVVPWLRAGGAFVTYAYTHRENTVMVEDLGGQATLGMDIGGTFIGMHLAPVAVPVHGELREIGAARVTMAWSRPKYVGGVRAKYE